jgi:hypothetical protein
VTAKQFFGMSFCKSWWIHSSGNPDWFEIPYHFFNLLEGTIWMLLSALVLARYIRYRHSIIEAMHSAAFFTFGLTDFREAYALQSWLIWLKLANLLLLVNPSRQSPTPAVSRDLLASAEPARSASISRNSLLSVLLRHTAQATPKMQTSPTTQSQ